MSRRFIRVSSCALLALLVFCAVALATRQSPASAFPAPPAGRPTFRQRLVAVGDLHGDIDHTKQVLRMADIIDQNANWKAGTDILVQTGDIVDRGTFASDIYRLMQSLRGQASGAGGQLISILGNHEIMNAIGDWRYVTQKDIAHFGSVAKRIHDLSKQGWLGKEWLANYTTTALVPLGPHPSAPRLSFTHGSLRPSFPNLTPYPDAINQLGYSLLDRALTPPLAPPHPPNPYSGLPKGSTSEEAELYASGGPYWWRGLAEMQDETVVCRWAKELQDKIGATRIIGGHTPNFDRIVDRCNASIIIIDTGISSAYGGVLSALEVTYTLTPFTPPHEKPDLIVGGTKYVEREEVVAIYPSRRHTIAVEQKVIQL